MEEKQDFPGARLLTSVKKVPLLYTFFAFILLKNHCYVYLKGVKNQQRRKFETSANHNL